MAKAGKHNKPTTIGEILPPDDDERPLFSGEAPEGEWSDDGRTWSVPISAEEYEQICKEQAKRDAYSKVIDDWARRQAGIVPAKKPTPEPEPPKPVESKPEPKKPGWRVMRIIAKLPEFFSNEIPDLSTDDDAMKAARAKVFIKMGSNPSDRDSIRRALIHFQKEQLRQKEQLKQK